MYESANTCQHLPPEDVISKGIPYIQSKLTSYGNDVLLKKFWAYFVKIWCKTYSITDWSIYHLLGPSMKGELINRTNNPLERYNRVLKSKFTSAHPSMITFVEVIKKLQCDLVQHLKDIMMQKAEPEAHDDAYIPSPIPSDYPLVTTKKRTYTDTESGVTYDSDGVTYSSNGRTLD
jgi:hypothetical protein